MSDLDNGLVDYADYAFPSPEDITPAQAGRLWDAISVQKAAVKKRLEALTASEKTAKALLIATLEIAETKGVTGVAISGGREASYSRYEFDAFNVVDPEAFAEWAQQQDENYYDPTPKLREGLLRDKMRALKKAGQALPPGVKEYNETRIQKSTKKVSE
jgi:uncharacterized protein (DUF1800 family)